MGRRGSVGGRVFWTRGLGCFQELFCFLKVVHHLMRIARRDDERAGEKPCPASDYETAVEGGEGVVIALRPKPRIGAHMADVPDSDPANRNSQQGDDQVRGGDAVVDREKDQHQQGHCSEPGSHPNRQFND